MIRDIDSQRLLESAIRENDFGLARTLLGTAVSIECGMLYASELGNNAFITLFLESGADVNAGDSASLRTALMHGRLDTARFLIQRGADLETILSENGCPILSLASANGHLSTVRFLLDRGADISADFEIAISVANQFRHPEVAKLLRNHQTVHKEFK